MSEKPGCDHRRHHGRQEPRHRHPSSFWTHDPDRVFRELALKEGDWFLDVGCGTGEYSVHASKIVGESGTVYALDKDADLIVDLSKEANAQGLRNIKAIATDITAPLPIQDDCIDVCLIATVLHIPNVARSKNMLFSEVRRVLRPHGRVAIVECKKEHWYWGPPEHIRLASEDIDISIAPFGYEKIGLTDLGLNYMIKFVVA
ncbi:methyltransferase domain-containing protein [Desulfomonile tiedjei]|uniref:Methylase involved in ubiquinone/menaquinone biosynthesis n=1 Tax=Desulfomonile tiedjei (strain ATCC 49306 / DSM 6799 / DCB-1) TaxID=706587 RepID=I4C2M1_DESTA|nr:methyltransferase domain-containing protein [Desulfomonile tiedjei]AFM23812.1 methylase involved in ubiquinone/menaquinone biosynthesis [Desulfomonile tiedjei DSM 6799]